jgi:hypothetical protein
VRSIAAFQSVMSSAMVITCVTPAPPMRIGILEMR